MGPLPCGKAAARSDGTFRPCGRHSGVLRVDAASVWGRLRATCVRDATRLMMARAFASLVRACVLRHARRRLAAYVWLCLWAPLALAAARTGFHSPRAALAGVRWPMRVPGPCPAAPSGLYCSQHEEGLASPDLRVSALYQRGSARLGARVCALCARRIRGSSGRLVARGPRWRRRGGRTRP
jgi:hypothetical protein